MKGFARKLILIETEEQLELENGLLKCGQNALDYVLALHHFQRPTDHIHCFPTKILLLHLKWQQVTIRFLLNHNFL